MKPIFTVLHNNVCVCVCVCVCACVRVRVCVCACFGSESLKCYGSNMLRQKMQSETQIDLSNSTLSIVSFRLYVSLPLPSHALPPSRVLQVPVMPVVLTL